MHIAIVRTVFDKSHGGAERYAVNLAQTWLAQGHRITIICQRHAVADAAGMHVTRVSRPKVLGPFKHRWFARRAGEAAMQAGADAVLSLARAYPGDVMRLGDGLHRAWLGARYPDFGQRRRALLNPRQQQLLKLERECFLPGRFQLYVANSAMIRRAVVHMYGVDPSRVTVIPNGVDTARFNLSARQRGAELRQRIGVPDNAPLVLFSGMDYRRKGLHEAVRGFIALSRTESAAHMVCVGRGQDRAARIELHVAGLEARAHFPGESDDMAGWYGAANVFVLPTMHDPSANAVTESLACGTPVVTSSENGARQHIVHGVNGFVIRSRTDAAEIGRHLLAAITQLRDPVMVADADPPLPLARHADEMLNALLRANAMRGASKVPPAGSAPATRTQALRRLKQELWAAGDGRDYRDEFRALR